MVLISISGGLGSGKSLFLTIYATHSKRKIVSNFTLKSKKYTEFDIDDFIHGGYSDCVILLDEVYQYIDSRSSMTDINKLFSYMLFQSRKKDVELFVVAQLRSSMDLRWRRLTDLRIDCQKSTEGFEYKLYNPKRPNENAIAILSFDQASAYFNLFDTNEIIMDQPKTARFMKPKKKLEVVKDLSEQMIKDYKKEFKQLHPDKKKINKITRPYVNIWVLKNEVPNDLN